MNSLLPTKSLHQPSAGPPPFRQGRPRDGGRIATGTLRPRNDRSRKNLRVIPRPVRRLVVGIRNTTAQRPRRTDCHSQCAHWLRNDTVNKRCCISPGGPMWIIGPYESATRGAMGGRPQGSPLRVGYKGCGAKMYPPVTASPCQPPLGKGAKGTGVAAIRFSRRTFIRFLYYRISRRAAPGQFINKPKEGIFYARLCYHDR